MAEFSLIHPPTHAHVRAHTHTHAVTHTHIRTHTHILTHTRMHTHTHAHAHMHTTLGFIGMNVLQSGVLLLSDCFSAGWPSGCLWRPGPPGGSRALVQQGAVVAELGSDLSCAEVRPLGDEVLHTDQQGSGEDRRVADMCVPGPGHGGNTHTHTHQPVCLSVMEPGGDTNALVDRCEEGEGW